MPEEPAVLADPHAAQKFLRHLVPGSPLVAYAALEFAAQASLGTAHDHESGHRGIHHLHASHLDDGQQQSACEHDDSQARDPGPARTGRLGLGFGGNLLPGCGSLCHEMQTMDDTMASRKSNAKQDEAANVSA